MGVDRNAMAGAKNQSQPIDNPFVIDEGDLWGEWMRMAQRTRDAAVREADARHEYNLADARLNVCRARLFHAIRKDPGKFDLPPGKAPSNDLTEAMVQIQPDFIRAVDDVNRARKDLDYAHADVEAFLTMRKTLENAVELLALNYRAEREPTPHTPMSREVLVDRRRREARVGGGRE